MKNKIITNKKNRKVFAKDNKDWYVLDIRH